MMASLIPSLVFAMIPGPHATLISGLIDAALRSLVAAAAVWAGLRLLRARNVVAQKAAWGLVLAGALAMPLLTAMVAPLAARLSWLPASATVVLPAHPWLRTLGFQPPSQAAPPQASPAVDLAFAPAAYRVSAEPSRTRAGATDSHASISAPPDRYPSPIISNGPSPSAPQAPHAAETRPSPVLSAFSMAWLLYLLVCGALLLRLLYGLGAAIHLWHASEPISIASAPHLTPGLPLRCNRKLTSPVTLGSGVVLPADYDEWDTEKLRIVLAHERSHVRQGDFYLQLGAGLYTALFWFSPLGWWLKRKLSDLSEAISDRAGLYEAASRATYAQILLEFAALPRTTQLGVAMARPGRLTHRIERLLNESSFRQAFAGGRRMLVALLLIPAALLVATALIRVQAAGQAPQQAPPAQEPTTGQAHPENAPDQVAPIQAPTAAQAPTAPTAPTTPAAPAPPSGPGSTSVPEGAPAVLPPPEPPDSDDEIIPPAPPSHGRGIGRGHGRSSSDHYSYSYSYSSEGDSYALVTGDGKNMTFSGDRYNGKHAEIDKARRMAHGDFLWFSRNGKSYIVEDPAIITKIKAMYQPMEELGRQQEALGRQQEELGRQQEKLGSQQEQTSVPVPDISKEMADLNESLAKLKAQKGGMVTQEQLAEVQEKIGELQGKLGGMQGEMGAKMGLLGEQQGKLGAQQGKLGAQQGRLGAEQGRLAMEADRKVKSIIDESMKDGKAKPVE